MGYCLACGFLATVVLLALGGLPWWAVTLWACAMGMVIYEMWDDGTLNG